MMMEIAMLKDSKISSKKVGMGRIMTMRIAMTPIAIIAELDLADSKNAFVPVLACGSAI